MNSVAKKSGKSKAAPASEGIRRAAARAGIEPTQAESPEAFESYNARRKELAGRTLTLTLPIGALRELFAAGNRSSGGGIASDVDPLAMALDIIDYAAEQLYVLHDALLAPEEDRTEELSGHAWRLSIQLTAGIELVQALSKATVTS
jgi:hypothetical protein